MDDFYNVFMNFLRLRSIKVLVTWTFKCRDWNLSGFIKNVFILSFEVERKWVERHKVD